MKITKTNHDLFEFLNSANQLKAIEPESKLMLKVQKQAKVVAFCLATFEELMEDSRVENCLVDEKGAVIKKAGVNPQGQQTSEYQFDKTGMLALNKKARELYKQTVEFEWFLTDGQIEECKDEFLKSYLLEFSK